MVAFIQTAIRIAFLLNGGAIVAALTVYGAVKGDVTAMQIALYSQAIGWWVTGLVYATAAVFLIGLAQRQFQASAGRDIRTQARAFGIDVEPGRRPSVGLGQTSRVLAIICWVLSMSTFAWGAYDAIPGALVK